MGDIVSAGLATFVDRVGAGPGVSFGRAASSPLRDGKSTAVGNSLDGEGATISRARSRVSTSLLEAKGDESGCSRCLCSW